MTLQANLESFADRVAQECKSIRTLLNSEVGNLSTLTTIQKSNLVSAVNELKVRIDLAAGINDAITATGSTWSSSKIASRILEEIAEALSNDSNFAAVFTDQLNRRVRYDNASQNLTDSQKLNARYNIGAVGAIDVGNLDFNYVNLFNTGLI